MNEIVEVLDGRSSLTVRAGLTEDLYDRFIKYLDAKPKTVETYTRALRPLQDYLYFKGITNPTREDILNYRDEIREKLKPTTVQNYITAARLFFQWTELEGIYPNIAKHIKGAKLDKEHKKDYLTSGQVKTVLSEIDRSQKDGARDYAILCLMITGGLRTIEVSRANIEDIRTVGDSTVLYIQGKGRDEKTEYIKISDQVEKAIREYLKTRDNAAPEQPLFISTSNNSKGKALTTRSISGIVKTRLKAAGYDTERLTAHSLRHTAVTLSLIGGKTLQEVQQFARHTNISTTQIYNHSLEKSRNNCNEAISDAIFK